ncbi:bifunctional diaminohydroxyphosphoribosylaminopyrimidine deaminase/5-amino-6-(5-phosphoribosylamino)uracil reductase RibD [Albimonas sp. CAU 1670]|uniref:bifunctional diaminohydroxyphosphoribosylaminopyrimidine deaminase/5-amino-6-(5-phosphoribosylamino)uracil reductase RibD n=1 Tax=Albimonas sp. CAU 1670 TaxID=3032599 RepID=UPI0023DBACDC|nr:bifunctional diaminohydroxyphosphoribosylaminopyrimidine deaminase/5-amino-6-(5-phosphoribosylamino)uracil reductase RibD [Albimonas sp. CAU 1670]MDF2232095.1 bifunctional diaminohydroxyphosphoribosylaminopyrimidine deaminase/5-amino-6-(5-phosphoribosylamino)uracil reductase RibD [Albimonas sp. CAU 1670]
MADDQDLRWMRVALSMARRAVGRTAPNPAVGCVIVKDGAALGRGFTQPSGRPHAETVALAQAEALFGPGAARGATAYVTLEPCAHHGRTPPCADALVAAGVARVVCAAGDPDPRVDGRGFARLREAGIAVETGVLAAEAEEMNAGFLSRHRRGRPWLTLKLATSLDGRIATASGDSKWITGPQARARVHLMRAEHDAILVGIGTVRADDPALDVRLPGLEDRSPLPVIFDPRLTLAAATRLGAGARPALVLHLPPGPDGPDPDRAAEMRDRGLTLQAVVPAAGGAGPALLDPAAALEALAAAGVTRAFCEGGGQLAGALLAAGLVDELALFTGGAAIGAEGLPSLGPLGLERLAQSACFRCVDTHRLGPDMMSFWRPA